MPREALEQNQANVTQTVGPTEQAVVKEETIFEKAIHSVEGNIPGSLKEKGEEMLGEMGKKLKGLFS